MGSVPSSEKKKKEKEKREKKTPRYGIPLFEVLIREGP